MEKWAIEISRNFAEMQEQKSDRHGQNSDNLIFMKKNEK